MAISKNILGMNARNYLYIRPFNKPSKIKIADDKLLTKERLIKNHIATPGLLAIFRSREEIQEFAWKLPQNGFVIKPARGYGGAGILPIISWNGEKAVSVSGDEYDKKQLLSHLYDILEGSYSLQFLPDSAFIERLITPDSFLRRLAPVGLADIRIIVFNSIPVMAMLRLPTKKSKGKANLHAGAIALGIDIRSGITTYAVSHNKRITTVPDSRLKVDGIEIPRWDDILLLASKTQRIIGLGYTGVDIVLDEKLGPLVLEVNSRPGLSIQIANQASLRSRLERVEDMEVVTSIRGVEIGKSLFGQASLEKHVPKVLAVAQTIKILAGDYSQRVEAKLDTGALRTSIDAHLASQLGLRRVDRVVEVKQASGTHVRNMVEITFVLAGRKIKTIASVVDRTALEFPMLIGRRDLQGFVIKPTLHEREPDVDNNEQEIPLES